MLNLAIKTSVFFHRALLPLSHFLLPQAYHQLFLFWGCSQQKQKKHIFSIGTLISPKMLWTDMLHSLFCLFAVILIHPPTIDPKPLGPLAVVLVPAKQEPSLVNEICFPSRASTHHFYPPSSSKLGALQCGTAKLLAALHLWGKHKVSSHSLHSSEQALQWVVQSLNLKEHAHTHPPVSA